MNCWNEGNGGESFRCFGQGSARVCWQELALKSLGLHRTLEVPRLQKWRNRNRLQVVSPPLPPPKKTSQSFKNLEDA